MLKKFLLNNVLMLCAVELFLLFMYLGHKNIIPGVFIIDLFTFAMLLIILTVYIYEKAYAKDSGRLAIIGIEIMTLAIITLFLPYSYFTFNGKYSGLNIISIYVFMVYYILKCFIDFILYKRSFKEQKEVNI